MIPFVGHNKLPVINADPVDLSEISYLFILKELLWGKINLHTVGEDLTNYNKAC